MIWAYEFTMGPFARAEAVDSTIGIFCEILGQFRGDVQNGQVDNHRSKASGGHKRGQWL